MSVDDEDILSSKASFDTTRTASANANIPIGAGAGFSYTLSNRYLLTGDFYAQQWGSTDLPKVGNAEFRNSSRLGIGLEIMPERDVDSYVRRVAYRLGFSYHSTYLKINSQPIDEYYFTGGLGLPISPEARVNIGLHVGFRGTTANGLQKDTIFKLSISLSASESWFLKIEED